MKIKAISPFLALVSVALAVYVCGTTLRGIANNFSVIPLQDQWDGFIGFVEQLSQGDLQSFWSVHVNHRLVIPRLIFLGDVEWFGGWAIFTTVIGILFGALTATVIAARIELSSAQWIIAASATAGLVFSWCHGDNYYYPFNIQNTSVTLFSIWAICEFSRTGNRLARVGTALVLAVLAELCAANGIFVFPVLALLALVMRRPIRELITVVLVGGIAIAAYMYQYTMPVYPISPDVANVHFAREKFALLLVGSPILRLVLNYNVCAVVGAMALFIGIGVCARTALRREVTNYRAFLIGGAAFCVVSMLAAAHGRWILGFAGAFAGRYANLPLLYYLFTILLIVDLAKARASFRFIVYAPLVLLAIIVPIQRGSDYVPNTLNAKLAVLGQKIGFDQPYYDSTIYNLAELHHYYLHLANFANLEQIGPYSKGWLHDAGIVKYDPALRDDTLCEGTFERAIKAETGHQVFGWLIPKRYARDTTLIVVTDQADKTIGYGVSGMARKDVRAAYPDASLDAGWSGFTGSADFGAAYAYLGGKFCKLQKVAQFTQ